MASDLDVHVNGSMLTDAQRQEAFYNQILRLQDEVFAGTHPRIKLPPDVLAQHAHLQTTTLPAQHPPTNGFVQGPSPSKTFDNSFGTVQDAGKTPYLNGNKAADGSVAFAHFSDGNLASGAKPPPASGLDPIFLQKSEVTVKAEQQLKRQRIERSLKDQYDIRKQTAWSEKDGNVETAAPFDISETLQKAQLLVKHVSGLKLVADRSSSGSDAIHTNSYYSSQDNWSSQGSQPSSQGAITNKQQHTKSIGIPLTGASMPQRQSQTRQLPRESEDIEEGEREESEEYEPPAADELGAAAPRPKTVAMEHRGREYPHRISPPMPAASVVRNHIETPFAPQPERVSPLAVTKMPQVGPKQPNDPGRVPSPRLKLPPFGNQGQNTTTQRGSPRAEQTQEDSSGSAQGKKNSPRTDGKDGNLSKKKKDNRRKRKLQAEAAKEQNRRTSGKRQALSPDFEPQIKEEPMSPPMESLSELPVAKRRQPVLVDDDVELVSPRRSDPFRGREYQPSQIAYRHEFERPESPSGHVPSHLRNRRPVERDDQDLRRLASLQYARRPFSPQSQYEEPRFRATSQAYIERPRYHEESIRPAAQSHHVQRVLSPATVYIDDDYTVPSRRIQTSSAMPPPPARPEVVIDQYGNRYIAAPPEPAYETRRASVAPAQIRRLEPELYERAVSRAPAKAVDPYDGEDELMQTSPRLAPRTTTTTRYMIDSQGREIELDRLPNNRELDLQDSSPRRYREARPPTQQPQPPRDLDRAFSVRPRDDDQQQQRLHVKDHRLREHTDMAPPPTIPRRQQSVVYDEVPSGFALAPRPASRVQRAYSVRPGAIASGDAEFMAPPPPPPPPPRRASVQPQPQSQQSQQSQQQQQQQQGRQPERTYLVRDGLPRGYRAVSVVHEGVGARGGGEEWAMLPPSRMEVGQGRVQYIGDEGDGGMQRVQSVRREYVDDPMEGVDDGYNGLAGRRVEYRY